MDRFQRVAVLVLSIVAFTSCGGSGGTTGPSVSKVGSGFQETAGEIHLSKDGRSFGSLYIEGSCDGSDNAGSNVTSSGAHNGRLRSRGGACSAEVAFSFEILGRGSNWIDVTTTLQSISGNLATVSLPIDTRLDVFPTDKSRWRTSGNRVHQGCERSGSFSTIPQPCVIPNLPPDNNHVGRVLNLDPYRWAEISGPFGGIRREYIGGDCSRLLFYRHPHTNNIEAGFRVSSSGITLHSGRTLTCRERISIL